MSQIVLEGNVRKVLEDFPDGFFHCAVTSPPYYGLRNYGTDGQVWGGDPDCTHDWDEVHPPGYRGSDTRPGPMQHEGNKNRENLTSNTCSKCGAWNGELGLEPTPDMYVQHLVEIFRELRRVLRDDGTFWLNIGDSYGRDPKKGDRAEYPGLHKNKVESGCHVASQCRELHDDYKPKDLIGIPWLLAFALRADGWYLRADLPWIKRNSMPSSVRDRPASSIEHVFLLAKSQKYYYDYVATMQPSSESYNKDKRPRGVIRQCVNAESKYPDEGQFKKQDALGKQTYTGFNDRYKAKKEEFEGKNIACDARDDGRRALLNIKAAREASGSHDQPFGALRYMRDSDFFFRTWQGLLHNEDGEPMALVVNPKGYKGAHFACFPVQLVEPMILAGTSEKGVCPECGSPWKRVIEKESFITRPTFGNDNQKQKLEPGNAQGLERTGGHVAVDCKTISWQPTCTCGVNPVSLDMCGIPATVLDPFAGSCATGVACGWNNRDFIGIELKHEYCELGRKRMKENK